jgi:hypothetical protein
MTRTSDRWKLPATIAGFLVLAIWGAIELLLPKVRQPSDAVTHVMLVIGAGLISPTFIVDLVRIWRASTPPSGEP